MKGKKVLFRALLGVLIVMAASCCSENVPTDNTYNYGTDGGITSCDKLLFDEKGKADIEGTYIGNGEQEFVFTGNQTLKKDVYILKGWVYIANGASLIVEPGTIIKGDKTTEAALVVESGGKIYAEGTSAQPIIFTSNQVKGNRKPGDWGGVIICGKAPNNQQNDQQIEGGPRSHHGGTDVNDNSGVMSYVRIEFAGYPFQKDKEINGLTLGSVGSGTKIDHIQVSYSNDDSFEWFGGTVNCNHLIAYKGWDDDFDTDNGYKGTVQFALSVRDPKIADSSQSNSFESDNCADGASSATPITSAIFSNVTVIGPNGRDNFSNDASFINGGAYNPNNGSALGKYQSAIQIRRSSRLNCFNSVFVGWPIGLILDGEKGNSIEQAKSDNLKVKNVWFANMDVVGSDANKVYADNLVTGYQVDASGKMAPVIDKTQQSYSHTYFLDPKNGNTVKNLLELLLFDPNNIGAAYMPQAGSPLLNAASFSDASLNGLQIVSYIGAFSVGDSWMNGWTNFDPNNTDY